MNTINTTNTIDTGSIFSQALHMIGEQFEAGSPVWFILFAALTIITAVYLARGFYILHKRAVESLNFVIMCVPILIWTALILLAPFLGLDITEGTWFAVILHAADVIIPVLLMFHVWSQVSYKPVMAMHRISYLIVPVVIVAVGVVHTFNSGTAAVSAAVTVQGELPAVSAVSVLSFVGAVYFIVMMVRSYLLCFNVFYQMPKHMRRSTYQMLVALSAMVAARGIVIYFSLSANLSDVFIAISYIIMLYSLYSAFFIANSANVIVTSRDFVFSSLSTIVITVSLKGNILDWNKKSKDGCNPLPSPKYKEPYAHYRQRIMAACNGVVSPHDENILMTITDNVEHHFLFTLHDISFLGRKFGYLVEISEVTTSYAVLRYLEEIALYDNLTGLHNRNAYIETAKHIGIPGNMPLLILVGDINNLKKVNDSVGHLIGDKLLMTITSIVRECAPENAFVARIGGDEIVLLVPNSGAEIGNRFVEAVGKACAANEGPDIGIPSISWGYGVMQSVAENYNEVFRAADAVMYEAKRAAKREVSISGIVPTA